MIDGCLLVEHERRDEGVERDRDELMAHVDEAIKIALTEYAAARQLGLACLGIAGVLWGLAALTS